MNQAPKTFGAEFMQQVEVTVYGCDCLDSTYEGRITRWYFGKDYLEK